MTSRFAALIVLLAALLFAPAAYAQSADGTWLTQAGDARVKISKCGGGICGHVVWLREPYDTATGQPATDSKNPNRELARRPMIGLPLAACSRPVRTNGPARFTMPTTAAPMPAASP